MNAKRVDEGSRWAIAEGGSSPKSPKSVKTGFRFACTDLKSVEAELRIAYTHLKSVEGNLRFAFTDLKSGCTSSGFPLPTRSRCRPTWSFPSTT